MLEAGQIHSEPARVFQKQQRMRAAGDKSAGFLFVEIFGKASADIRNRTTDICAANHHREVTDISSILLLKVIVEPIFRHSAGRECGPGPVLLPLHHSEHLLSKPFPIHRLPRNRGILMNLQSNEDAKT